MNVFRVLLATLLIGMVLSAAIRLDDKDDDVELMEKRAMCDKDHKHDESCGKCDKDHQHDGSCGKGDMNHHDKRNERLMKIKAVADRLKSMQNGF